MLHAVHGRIRVAIVDSEPNTRDRLRQWLDAAMDVEVVGAGSTDGDAVALADAVSSDLIFLGMRPPDLNGMAALEAVPRARRSAVVFVTDREEYAYRAFELQAVDYLLSPIDAARFEQAMWRARGELLSEGARFMSVVAGLRATPRPPRRLMVKSPGQVTFLDLDEIDWIESAGNYTRVHTGAVAYLTRETMGGMETRLDARFLRVHRSSIVNTNRIGQIRTDAERVWVVLKDGTEVPAGRYIVSRLAEWMSDACAAGE
jgi:two-component system LytT family response regulator